DRPSERQFHSRRQGKAGRDRRHFFLRRGFGLAQSIVEGRGDEVFKHVLVFLQKAWVYIHPLDVITASHGYLDQATASSPFHHDIGQGFLGLLHVFLHLLRLLHQAGELTFHHIESFLFVCRFSSGSPFIKRCNRARNHPGTEFIDKGLHQRIVGHGFLGLTLAFRSALLFQGSCSTTTRFPELDLEIHHFAEVLGQYSTQTGLALFRGE